MSASNRAAASIAAVFLGVVIAMALLPGWFTAVDPLQTDVSNALAAPTAGHPFGTDQSGRDVYARVVYGARASLGIAALATALAWAGGLLIGTGIALLPKRFASILMRGVDLLLAVPEFLLALVIVAALGPGLQNVALAIMLSVLPVYIRLAWARAGTLRVSDQVEASWLIGVRPGLVVARHIAPGVTGTLSVLAVIGMGTSILSAAGLSFLGLGLTEPEPEWGLILAGGRNVLAQAWWIAAFPGLAITLTVIATSVIGRALRRPST